jgi:hypothetical protein
MDNGQASGLMQTADRRPSYEPRKAVMRPGSAAPDR